MHDLPTPSAEGSLKVYRLKEPAQAQRAKLGGGFTLHVTQVRENRGYLASHHIDVPWSNKNLDIKWEHFVSKLEPSQKETWTAVITRNVAADVRRLTSSESRAGDKKDQSLLTSAATVEKAVAEMVATLYDESLDAFMNETAFFFPQLISDKSGDLRLRIFHAHPASRPIPDGHGQHSVHVCGLNS